MSHAFIFPVVTWILNLGSPTYSCAALRESTFNSVKSGFFTDSGSFAMFIRQIFVSSWKMATEYFIWFYSVCCDLSDNSINNNVKVVSVVVLLGF